MIPYAFEVAANPVTIAIGLPWRSAVAIDALDKDQPVRIDRQDSIARPLCRSLPIDVLLTTSPASWSAWFIMQIAADNPRIAFLVLRQHHPLTDPP